MTEPAAVAGAEIRVDPLTGLRSIIGGGGGELAITPQAPIDPRRDALAAGNEAQTAPELFAVRPDGGMPDGPGWTVRVLPTRSPALDAGSPEAAPEANRDLFWAGPAHGAQEVIVNAPEPVSSLADLDCARVDAAVEVWRERMRANAGAAYLHLGIDERPGVHSHAELYALEFVPAAVARERERFGAYATRTMGANLLGDLLQEEVRRRERVVAIDSECVLLAAFAARVPFQLLVVPRSPRMRFEDDGPTGAAMLHDALRRLARRFGVPPPLSAWVRTAPRGAEHFCWRIDIHPQLRPAGGLELGTGVFVNPVAPERAAAELREL